MESNSGLRQRSNSSVNTPEPQNSRHFILTIPHHHFTPFLPVGCVYIKGQLELAESGFLHWQVVVATGRSCRIAAVKKILGSSVHIEPIRSDAAYDYVWKEDTAVTGTRFELGKKPFVRGRATDWEAVRESAQAGTLMDVPADIYVRFDMGLFI